MRHQRQFLIVACTIIVILAHTSWTLAGLGAPATPRHNVREVLHGVEVVDPYRWLEDQHSPETRAWIAAQNQYTESVLSLVPGRQKIRQKLEALMRIDDIETPIHRNGRYFFARRSADQDLDLIYVRQGTNGENRVLVDPHPLSPHHSISAGILEASADGQILAYSIREGGEDEVSLMLLDVSSGESLKDKFPKARYSDIRFTPEGTGLYYVKYTPEGERVYYHPLGSDPAGDAMVFGEGYGLSMGISVDLSDDGRYLVFDVYHGSAARKSEVYFKDLIGDGEVKTIVNDIDARFDAYLAGNNLYLVTTWEAPHGRVLAVDLKNAERQNWQEIIPEKAATIRRFRPAGGRLLVNYLDNVIPAIKVFDATGDSLGAIQPPAVGWLGTPEGRWQDNEVFYYFSSYHIPPTIYSYDLSTLTQAIWDQVEVPIDSGSFEIEQVWYESADGTAIPMFVAHRQGLELDGSNPTLLTGYGGFSSSQLPWYSSQAALWIMAGGVYAVPNLRGGGEFGEDWHRAGMLEQKQNTFDDFIAAAEWLIDTGYTNADRLAITGASNGGLLVGAALTQRPDLFKAVVCGYPLLDMVRYHKFLVGHWWVSEYGSADDPDQFQYLYAYSPYHRVAEAVKYPAVLLITGDSDTRVDPAHARKMTALLQASTGSGDPVLLHYDTQLGHSGGRPVTKRIEDLALEMGFLAWQVGLEL